MELNFEKLDGLVPAIVQDARSNKVLMLAFMNRESLERTFETGLATFYSRTRQKLWTKGETSGNYLRVKEVVPDCDEDTVLVRVVPDGPACHTGSQTCFQVSQSETLSELTEVIERRRDNPNHGSYTSQLFSEGVDRIAQKVGEEAVEVVIAAKNEDDNAFKSEVADLLFHLMTLIAARKMRIDDVLAVLADRRAEARSS